MLSNRSKYLAVVAVLALLDSSCLFSGHADSSHTLALKSGSESDLAHAQAQAQRVPSDEPEYVESSTPPEIPAALPEQRPAAPSSAHVWIAGHHTRRAGEWVWVAGQYAMPPRPDVTWVPGHWVDHLHGYVWIGGAWR